MLPGSQGPAPGGTGTRVKDVTALCPGKRWKQSRGPNKYPTATLVCIFPSGDSSKDWGNPTSPDFLGMLEDKKDTCLHLSF